MSTSSPIVLRHQRDAGSRVEVYQDGQGNWRAACYVGESKRPTWDVEGGTRDEALKEAVALGAVLPEEDAPQHPCGLAAT